MRCCTLAGLVGSAVALAALCWLLFPLQDNEVTRICNAAAWFKDTNKAFHLAEESTYQAYIDSCRTAFPTLEEPARFYLRYAERAGLLPLLTSSEGDSRRQQKPRPNRTTTNCQGSTPFKTLEEITVDKGAYMAVGIRPLKERVIPASEVGAAFKRAEVARFDATQFLERKWFNVSLADISALHPDSNDKIGFLLAGGYAERSPLCFEWLQYFTEEVPRWGFKSARSHVARRIVIPFLLSFVCPRDEISTSLRELGEKSRNFHTDPVPYSAFTDQRFRADTVFRRISKKNRSTLGFASINLQRFPNFLKDVDFANLLGFDGMVETSHSLIWTGMVNGDTHPDWQDNIVIQLSGEDEMVIFPANCSKFTRLPADIPTIEFVRRRQRKGEIPPPFFHVKLKAGEGITIPSMAVHRVCSQHSSRVAVNAFFEPKWSKMQWESAPANFYRRQNLHMAALRVLWIRAAKDLYKSRKLTLFMHTAANDFF